MRFHLCRLSLTSLTAHASVGDSNCTAVERHSAFQMWTSCFSLETTCRTVFVFFFCKFYTWRQSARLYRWSWQHEYSPPTGSLCCNTHLTPGLLSAGGFLRWETLWLSWALFSFWVTGMLKLELSWGLLNLTEMHSLFDGLLFVYFVFFRVHIFFHRALLHVQRETNTILIIFIGFDADWVPGFWQAAADCDYNPPKAVSG